jgi:tetratricopeptide (TPR) repeat protein
MFQKQLVSKIGLVITLIIIVCAAVLYVHWPALSAKATSFDDNQYLINNVLVKNPSLTSARRFLTEILSPSTVEGYYQPLAMISLMLDYALGGRENNLLPFHRTSLILHIANTALIIVLLYLLFGQPWIAAAVGLLFGVHPMTVEPIPWVGERKTLLAAFFSLWSLIFYVYSRKAHHARRTTVPLYIGSFVAYLLALMSKPTSTPLPVVMLLLDYWPLRRLNWRAVLEKIPLFVLGGISAIITYISQSQTAATVSPAAFGAKRILLILCHNIVFYPFKMIWPVNLSSHYAFPEPLALSHPMVLAGVIGTFILILLLLFSLRWTRAVLTGWLIFFIAIFPTMGAVGFTNVIAADKFAYLPAIGLLMMLASFLVWFLRRKSAAGYFAVTIIVLTLAAAESIGTRQYLAHWRDTIGFYRYMLSLTPDAAVVNNNLGLALQSQNKLDEAMACYQKALRSMPDYAESHNNLAAALFRKGDIDGAVSHYQQAIRLKPNYAEARNNIGSLFLQQNKLTEAITHFQKASILKPDNPDIYYNLGIANKHLGSLDTAVEYFRKALILRPDDIEVCCELAMILLKQNKPKEALAFALRAADLTKYKDIPALELLASAYAAAGRFDNAAKTTQQIERCKQAQRAPLTGK